MARSKKKQNIFVAYFSDFGIRQLCDILMLIGGVVLLVGLCTTDVVVTVGLGFYIAATLLALFRSVKVLLSGVNRRSPEYKASIVNTVVMGLILALAVFGFIWSIIS